MYCDQKTDGGGWTLVWTYTFTDPTNFESFNNAITPLPSWNGGRNCDSPVSRTPPRDESSTGAMEFNLWSSIGSTFLIKSNIINWMSCSSLRGSFVEGISGSINCRLIAKTTQNCQKNMPNMIKFPRQGPMCGPIIFRKPRFPGTPQGPGMRPTHGRPPKPPRIRCENKFIEFNGSSNRNWPVHDACGTCSSNHLKGVANPRVNVYIRA